MYHSDSDEENLSPSGNNNIKNDIFMSYDEKESKEDKKLDQKQEQNDIQQRIIQETGEIESRNSTIFKLDTSNIHFRQNKNSTVYIDASRPKESFIFKQSVKVVY